MERSVPFHKIMSPFGLSGTAETQQVDTLLYTMEMLIMFSHP